MSDSLVLHGLWPTRLLCPWEYSRQNTGVGFHFFSGDPPQLRDRTHVSLPWQSSYHWATKEACGKAGKQILRRWALNRCRKSDVKKATSSGEEYQNISIDGEKPIIAQFCWGRFLKPRMGKDETQACASFLPNTRQWAVTESQVMRRPADWYQRLLEYNRAVSNTGAQGSQSAFRSYRAGRQPCKPGLPPCETLCLMTWGGLMQ